MAFSAIVLRALFSLVTPFPQLPAKFTEAYSLLRIAGNLSQLKHQQVGEVADKKTNLQFSFSLSVPTTKLQSNSILTEIFNGDKTIINLMKKEWFQ